MPILEQNQRQNPATSMKIELPANWDEFMTVRVCPASEELGKGRVLEGQAWAMSRMIRASFPDVLKG
jgi:hypothetical protein